MKDLNSSWNLHLSRPLNLRQSQAALDDSGRRPLGSLAPRMAPVRTDRLTIIFRTRVHRNSMPTHLKFEKKWSWNVPWASEGWPCTLLVIIAICSGMTPAR